jgi:hypothetical protein
MKAERIVTIFMGILVVLIVVLLIWPGGPAAQAAAPALAPVPTFTATTPPAATPVPLESYGLPGFGKQTLPGYDGGVGIGLVLAVFALLLFGVGASIKSGE